jgi:hypothetical protein
VAHVLEVTKVKDQSSSGLLWEHKRLLNSVAERCSGSKAFPAHEGSWVGSWRSLSRPDPGDRKLCKIGSYIEHPREAEYSDMPMGAGADPFESSEVSPCVASAAVASKRP